MNELSNMDKEYKSSLEDNFLRHIGFEHVHNLCRELDMNINGQEGTILPESLDLWFDAYYRQELRKKKRNDNRIRVMRQLKKAAIFILLLVGVNYFLVISVDAYRVRFFNTIMNIQERFTQIDYVKDSNQTTIPDNWDGYYYPSYIPEGYQLDSVIGDTRLVRVIHYVKEDQKIIFQQFTGQPSIQVDSEGGIVERIEIFGDQKAVFVEKENYRSISWTFDDRVFFLQSSDIDITKNHLIKIAESLEIKK
ncbi:DUF4367 domain-containing protein [Mobilitalea sibirica]|uniref:DUF4367 domain-containing protein n=1 Tax=Mobilitalea sibirica TaxID=1462919 RepID=A0A8J7HBN2_9FIRM|nr:DUF4367 domain-containing protein [Mobilitalea sibirica]MBH1940177.1 DUF4367 domain-containing protein [Mobilitalea sibirica]